MDFTILEIAGACAIGWLVGSGLAKIERKFAPWRAAEREAARRDNDFYDLIAGQLLRGHGELDPLWRFEPGELSPSAQAAYDLALRDYALSKAAQKGGTHA